MWLTGPRIWTNQLTSLAPLKAFSAAPELSLGLDAAEQATTERSLNQSSCIHLLFPQRDSNVRSSVSKLCATGRQKCSKRWGHSGLEIIHEHERTRKRSASESPPGDSEDLLGLTDKKAKTLVVPFALSRLDYGNRLLSSPRQALTLASENPKCFCPLDPKVLLKRVHQTVSESSTLVASFWPHKIQTVLHVLHPPYNTLLNFSRPTNRSAADARVFYGQRSFFQQGPVTSERSPFLQTPRRNTLLIQMTVERLSNLSIIYGCFKTVLQSFHRPQLLIISMLFCCYFVLYICETCSWSMYPCIFVCNVFVIMGYS